MKYYGSETSTSAEKHRFLHTFLSQHASEKTAPEERIASVQTLHLGVFDIGALIIEFTPQNV